MVTAELVLFKLGSDDVTVVKQLTTYTNVYIYIF